MGIDIIMKSANFSNNGFIAEAEEILETQTNNAKVLSGKAFYTQSPSYRIFNNSARSTTLIPKDYKYKNVPMVSDVTDGNYVPIVLPEGAKKLNVKCDAIQNTNYGVFYGTLGGSILWDSGWKATGTTVEKEIPVNHQNAPLVLQISFSENLSSIGEVFDASTINLDIEAEY